MIWCLYDQIIDYNKRLKIIKNKLSAKLIIFKMVKI